MTGNDNDAHYTGNFPWCISKSLLQTTALQNKPTWARCFNNSYPRCARGEIREVTMFNLHTGQGATKFPQSHPTMTP